MENNKEEWFEHSVKPRRDPAFRRGMIALSVEVDFINEDKTEGVAYFDFDDNKWYAKEGVIKPGFKWKYIPVFYTDPSAQKFNKKS